MPAASCLWVQMDYRFSQAVSLDLGTAYILQRINFIKVDSHNQVSDSLTFQFDILTIPVNVQVWTNNGRFFVSAGLGVKYYMNATARYPEYKKDISSELKKFNFYAQFGGGFILSLGRPYLRFEIRYAQGLRDINTTIVHEDDYHPRTKITGMRLAVSLFYPIGNADNMNIHKRTR